MKFFKGKTSLAEMTDEALMEKFRRGDSSAFDELYRRYAKRMYYYFYKMLARDCQTAEDFTHDLFVKLISNSAKYDSSKKFSSWIYAIAYNHCKNYYSSKRLEYFSIDDIEIESDSDIYQIINKKDAETMIDKLLDNLNPEHRAVVILKYREENSLAEIAEITQTPIGTVKSRLFYALKKLGDEINKETKVKP